MPTTGRSNVIRLNVKHSVATKLKPSSVEWSNTWLNYVASYSSASFERKHWDGFLAQGERPPIAYTNLQIAAWCYSKAQVSGS
jgi:hypothetical protein